MRCDARVQRMQMAALAKCRKWPVGRSAETNCVVHEIWTCEISRDDFSVFALGRWQSCRCKSGGGGGGNSDDLMHESSHFAQKTRKRLAQNSSAINNLRASIANFVTCRACVCVCVPNNGAHRRGKGVFGCLKRARQLIACPANSSSYVNGTCKFTDLS